MNAEKSKISKEFPISINFYFGTDNMYLYPQGFVSRGNLSKINCTKEKPEYEHFGIIYSYYFKWLFLTIIFKTRLTTTKNTKQ